MRRRLTLQVSHFKWSRDTIDERKDSVTVRTLLRRSPFKKSMPTSSSGKRMHDMCGGLENFLVRFLVLDSWLLS